MTVEHRALLLPGLFLFLGSTGCSYSIKYTQIIKNRIEPVAIATSIVGSFDEAKALFDQAELPHNSVRERWKLHLRATQMLRTQLGSDEYEVIGHVFGEGDDSTTLKSVKLKLCERAAREGGDVVLVIQSGLESMPFAFSMPGTATTNVQGSAYVYGNYAHGSASAHTTYSPGATIGGTLYFPFAGGFVFKHVPGTVAREVAMTNLPDSGLAWAIGQTEKLAMDRSITFEECLRRVDRVIEEAKKR